ncbi:MAG: hypothetical protein KBD50_03930 [Candidatus Pacebacteria bacterium]|nr:hypothetical protein [Candidatus Paceibacterota bacterium]
MSTNLIIGIVAALAVVGGGTYVAMNPEIVANITGGAHMEDESTELTENENESASVGSTFAQIIALGQSVTCTFSYNDGGENVSSGTIYMTAGGKELRGDFKVMSPISTEASFIRTGGYNYMWGPAMPQGIKTKVTNEAELMSDGQSAALDPNTKFGCQAWNVDSSKFTLPATVKFMDVSASAGIDASVQVPGGSVNASGSASVKAQQCGACATLPAGAKEQCLAALSC